MYAGENMRVGGEGAYYDKRANSADSQARLAEVLAGSLLAAIERGPHDTPIARAPGDTVTAADALCLMYGEEQTLLFQACHLTLSGKFEAGSAKLIEFITAATRRYGSDAAESFCAED